jgi:hypothetical protein
MGRQPDCTGQGNSKGNRESEPMKWAHFPSNHLASSIPTPASITISAVVPTHVL